MKLQRLEISGFGRLHDTHFDLAPGLNVFLGHNEAGKSTLQQSILALLYGFRQGRRDGAPEREWVERYRPWHSAVYGGTLTYRLDSGSSYSVTRLAVNGHFDTKVIEAGTGKDIAGTLPSDHLGNVDFSGDHLGVPREVFLGTHFVRHMELGPLSDVAYDIADTILGTGGKARLHRAVSGAQDNLRRALREGVGTERAANSPLSEADERLHALMVEKTLVAMESRNRTQDLVMQARLQTSIEIWKRERDELKYFINVNRANSVSFRLFELERLAETEAGLAQELEELQAVAGFPASTRDFVAQLTQDLKTHGERLARLEGAAAPARAQVEELQSEAARLREEVRRLESARYVPVEHEQATRELERALPEAIRAHQKADEELKIVRQAIGALEGVQKSGTRRHMLTLISPERLRESRTRYEALQAEAATAASEAQIAGAAWEATGLDTDSYDTLALRTSGLTPEILADLKTKQSKADGLNEERVGVWYTRSVRLGILLVTLFGAVGLSLIAATLANRSFNRMFEGGLLLIAAFFVASGTALMRLMRAQGERKRTRLVENLRARLMEHGASDVEELEASLARYLGAQPAHDAWQMARRQLERTNSELAQLRAELGTLFNLPAETELSADHFAYLELEAVESNRDVAEHGQLEARRAELETEVAARREAMQSAIEQTRTILKSAGIVEMNLVVDLRSLLALFDQRRELDRLESQLKTLEESIGGRLQTTLGIEADVRSERTAVMSIEEELRLVLVKAGIEAASAADGLLQYNDRGKQYERYQRVQAIVQSLERERAALLRNETIESLSAQQKQAAATIQKLSNDYPHLANMRDERSPEALEADIAELQHRISQARQSLAEIETRLSRGFTEMRALAEVAEDIERAQQRLDRLTFEGRALQVAMDALEAAADDYTRNFLPRLNRTIARRLEAVTDGHYAAVEVDRGDFGIRVQAPELKRFIRPENFSQGVQDQIYLLLRLGLAEMVSEGRETLPFLLDDPFVNYDSGRLALTLDMLAHLAEETQFLLFTKDEQIAQWAQTRGLDPERHTVHILQ